MQGLWKLRCLVPAARPRAWSSHPSPGLRGREHAPRGASPDSRGNLEPGEWPPRPGASGSIRITGGRRRRWGHGWESQALCRAGSQHGIHRGLGTSLQARARLPLPAGRTPSTLSAPPPRVGLSITVSIPSPSTRKLQPCVSCCSSPGLPLALAAGKPGRQWRGRPAHRVATQAGVCLPSLPHPEAGPGLTGAGAARACGGSVCLPRSSDSEVTGLRPRPARTCDRRPDPLSVPVSPGSSLRPARALSQLRRCPQARPSGAVLSSSPSRQTVSSTRPAGPRLRPAPSGTARGDKRGSRRGPCPEGA